MTCAERAAAEDVLHYNEQTWGRAWGFAERFFHDDVSVFDWLNGITDNERKVLEDVHAGWTATSWADPAYKWSTAHDPSIDWSALSSTQRTKLTSIGFSQWLWDNVKQQTTQVIGCFYDGARGEVAKSIWKSATEMVRPTTAATACLRPSRRSRRESGHIACPAGEYSSSSFVCTACAKGSYKDDSMAGEDACRAKGLACTSPRTAWTDGPSKIYDDFQCTPVGFCNPGEKKDGASCTDCTGDTFQNRPTQTTSCIGKAATKCGPGQYFSQGSSIFVDDNLCITCPPNTFSAAENTNTACVHKTVPSVCDAGQQLAVGTSGTKDDNQCVACPTGTFKTTPGYIMCAAKTRKSCSAGFYFRAGSSAVADDNDCIACPVGTYQESDGSAAAACKPKSPAFCSASDAGNKHITGNSKTTNDYFCVPTGQCPKGYKVNNGNCDPCEAGSFSTETSTATSCTDKEKRSCPAGHFVDYGKSTVADTSRCTECPQGSFITSNSGKHSDTSCKLKTARVLKCDKGTHVSPYMSRTVSDHACIACPPGKYQGSDQSTVGYCTHKAPPTSCGAGLYISEEGTANDVDDWKECAVCKANEFKTELDSKSATSCATKKAASSCRFPEVLVLVAGKVADNRCQIPGRCPMGQRRTSPGDNTCVDCGAGTYNPGWSTDTTCTSKVQPKSAADGPNGCPAGFSFSKPDAGESTIRDDWKCLRCPLNTFSASVVTAPSICVDKGFQVNSADRCPYGQMVHRGNSATEDDWYCVPSPRYTALCANVVQEDARSMVPGFITGLPERIAPFLKSYYASMSVDGYARVDKKMFAAVVGERFISAAETVPFPEGMPLLVLHDPPGGASFASYENIATTVVFVQNMDSSSKRVDTSIATRFGSHADLDYGTGMTPFSINGIDLAIGLGPSFSFTHEWLESEDYGGASDSQADEKKQLPKSLGNSEFSFTYQTASDPNKAGAASDTFLMPSATFEITEVWTVRLSEVETADKVAHCLISGRSDKTLSPNKDLDGFYFTQANDVETRTLTVLKMVAEDTKHLIDCNFGSKPCCTAVDLEFGCTEPAANTNHLGHYCDWRHGISESERTGHKGWEECSSIELRHFKTMCKRASIKLEPKAFWTGCSEAPQLSCPAPEIQPDGFNRTYKEVGSPQSCLMGTLDAPAPDGSSVVSTETANNQEVTGEEILATGDAASDVPTAPTPTKGTRIQCKQIQAPIPDSLPECKRGSFEGNNVKSWCQQAHADVKDQVKCESFEESDKTSKAYDSWFNTLERNYAKQRKANGGLNLPVNYQTIDTLSTGAELIPGLPVLLDKMTSLAPTALLENAMQSPGVKSTKEQKYRDYNTLSFEGGGSSLEFSWHPAKSDTKAEGVNFEETRYDYHEVTGTSYDVAAGLNIDAEFNSYVYFSMDAYFGGGGGAVGMRTTTIDQDSVSHSLFHLEDPNNQDYFVLTVWKDPDYPTAIFALQGGASSCGWEINTNHITAPTMYVEYIGPERLLQDQTAIFKVTVAQAVNYYDAGVAQDKDRPGWVAMDYGYASSQKTISLAVKMGTAVDGLQIFYNGDPFSNEEVHFDYFAKGSFDILIEITRGPIVYEYSAPLLTFAEACDGGKDRAWTGIGEISQLGSLGMTGGPTARKIKYMQECQPITWSGTILSANTFMVIAGSPTSVDFMVLNPKGGKGWNGDSFESLQLQYRYRGPSAVIPAWTNVDKTVSLLTATPNNADPVAGVWPVPAGAAEGEYEIRVLALCEPVFGAPDEYKQSSTSIIRGIVDVTKPKVVAVQTSAKGNAFVGTDVITVTYDEPIFCSGYSVDVSGSKPKNVKITPLFKIVMRGNTYSGGGGDAGLMLRYECHGSDVRLSLGPSGREDYARRKVGTTLTERQLSVSIENVVDFAGNIAESPTGSTRHNRGALTGSENEVGTGSEKGEASRGRRLYQYPLSQNGLTLEAEACPGIEWAGQIKRDDGFVVTGHANAPTSITLEAVDVSNGGWEAGGVTQLRFEYRMLGVKTWRLIEERTPQDFKYDTVDKNAAAQWSIGDPVVNTGGVYPDGLYELRAIVKCGAVMQSSTAIVTGTIDQVKPKIVALETSNKGNTFVKTDVITVTYSEPVLCSGMNQMLDTPINPKITLRVRDVVLTWTGNDDNTNHLRYECDGAVKQKNYVNQLVRNGATLLRCLL